MPNPHETGAILKCKLPLVHAGLFQCLVESHFALFLLYCARKKKKKKDAKKALEQISMIRQSSEGGEEKHVAQTKVDTRTPAEKAFAKVQEKRVRVTLR